MDPSKSVPETEGLGIPLSKVGFPIRTSADQSFFAAPRGFSQRSTSFIASQRQGIHRTPLRHLIALIINAHPLGSGRAIVALNFAVRGEQFDRLDID
jgi:hypothetical protein